MTLSPFTQRPFPHTVFEYVHPVCYEACGHNTAIVVLLSLLESRIASSEYSQFSRRWHVLCTVVSEPFLVELLRLLIHRVLLVLRGEPLQVLRLGEVEERPWKSFWKETLSRLPILVILLCYSRYDQFVPLLSYSEPLLFK
jgi:tRNA(Met) C34 N-acetyltransferase TmcA